MTSISTLRTRLDKLTGERDTLEKQRRNLKRTIRETKQRLIDYELAREIVRQAGLKTQQMLQYHISDICSMAMEAVFPEPYTLDVSFVERRNKSECDLFFSRDGERINPMLASGGGAVDIASFALRVTGWSMEKPRSRNVIILDEPLKNLSKTYQDKGSLLLKELSEKLGIQFIIVTHEQVLTSYADKIFEVTMEKGRSKVVEKLQS